MHKFITLDDIDVSNKKILVRLDLNVPMKDGKVENNERIVRSLTTLKELISKKAKVIVVTHLGRPSGNGFESKFSCMPIALELSALLKTPVKFCRTSCGQATKDEIDKLQPGEVLMLENIRFNAGEETNDPALAKELASFAEVFVSDAFSAAHRSHASTVGIASYLPAVAGRLMENELSALESALEDPEHPVVAVIGGAKISTKLGVFHNLLKKVDTIIVSGGMANTFLHALGIDVQKSLCEPTMKDECLHILEEAKAVNCHIELPIDAQIALNLNTPIQSKIHSNHDLPKDYEIFDVGPLSLENFKQILNKAKTLLWNGPLGVFEVAPFDEGTTILAKHAAELTRNKKLISVAGGGDTVSALEKAGVYNDFTYISTAGGAFLEWLEGKELPGVAILSKK